jgi:hypothetical protein
MTPLSFRKFEPAELLPVWWVSREWRHLNPWVQILADDARRVQLGQKIDIHFSPCLVRNVQLSPHLVWKLECLSAEGSEILVLMCN